MDGGWSESSSSWLEQGDERDIKITGLVETLLVLAEIHGRVLISNSREVDPWSQHHRIQILTTINIRKETALSVPWCKPSKWNRFLQTVRQILVLCNSSSRKLKYAKSSPCSWSNAKHYLEVKHYEWQEYVLKPELQLRVDWNWMFALELSEFLSQPYKHRLLIINGWIELLKCHLECFCHPCNHLYACKIKQGGVILLSNVNENKEISLQKCGLCFLYFPHPCSPKITSPMYLPFGPALLTSFLLVGWELYKKIWGKR